MNQDPIAAVLRPFVDDGWMPGAAWCVASAGKLPVRGAVGLAEPGTIYDLASLTKPLATATLAQLAHSRGDLDLDAPWLDWLPEFRGSLYAGRTPSDVLRHRAGFPAWLPLYLNGTPLLEQLACIPPVVDENRELYSDLGYMALGVLLERVEGCSLDEAFRRRVSGVLGLPGLAFARTPRVDAAPTELGNAYEASLAGESGEGYEFRQSMLRGEVHDGNARALDGVAGHAGLFGSTAEVAALAFEWLVAERLPWNDTDSRRFRVLPGATRSEGWVTASGCGAARGILPGHWQGQLGFTGCSLFLDPQDPAVLVLLSNRVHPVVRSRGFESPRRAFHQAALMYHMRSAAGPPTAD